MTEETMICPKCGSNNSVSASFCVKCGSSLVETQTTNQTANAWSILEQNIEKRIQTETSGKSQKDKDFTSNGNDGLNSKPLHSNNSVGSGLGCYLKISITSLVIAGISYVFLIGSYDQQNPWAGLPLLWLDMILVPVAAISGIIGIIDLIMKAIAKNKVDKN